MKRNIVLLLFVAALMAVCISTAVVTYRARELRKLEQPQRVQLIPAQPGETAGTVQEPEFTDMPDFRGKPAPALNLKDTEGKAVSLADYKGKAVLINFWATWCAPCKVETPWIVALRQKYGPQGFVVLGVDADDPKETPDAEIKKTAGELKIDYPVLYGGASVAKQWGGLDALPTSFYVGRDGKVVEQTQGLNSKDEMEASIKKALAAGA